MGFRAAVVVLAVGVHLVVGDIDFDRIKAKIAAAEINTTGEIVCVLAKQSDKYKYIPILWAAILALAVPLFFMLYEGVFVEYGSYADTRFGIYTIYIAQLCVFLIAFLSVQYQPLKYWLVPNLVKTHRAKRLAAEQFMMQKVHLTDEHTGVLLFISLGEHYTEVIADKGIYGKLGAEIWQDIVDELVLKIKANQMTEGIEQAVEKIGVLLAEHFPASGNNPDELPNHLILID